MKIDTNIQPVYATSVEKFNEYVRKYRTKNKIILTDTKNISQESLFKMPCSGTWQRGNRMEFHYIDGKKHIRVIYAVYYEEDAKTDTKVAYEAKNYFKGLLDVIPKDDVEPDTEMFLCPENQRSAYYNYINPLFQNMIVKNCYSLDRNNSFPASMIEEYPQTRPFIEKYYNERLEMKHKYKQGLVPQEQWEKFKLYGSIIIGWFKRERRTHAWKRVISNSNRKVHELREYIESHGNTVLLVNTDAVKFIGEVPYKETEALGGFKYEWKDADMFIKGVKSYAYRDKGSDKWMFKQAGKCLLDAQKPRCDWTLEDFKANETVKVKVITINKQNGELVEKYEDKTRN